ncbi:hypothetical protein [Anaerorhabdus sp.]|uniref:hypothetical protein n=1 Tax=Anaerorhabdus sp. TaxID=1872524 RepID=UPI002FCBCB32
MKDLMMHYGVTLGIRYTKKQKDFFVNQLKEELNKNRIEYQIKTKKVLGKSINNILIGNMRDAETVLVCAYDTPRHSWNPKTKYYPFNEKKNTKQITIDLILKTCLVILLLLLSYLLYLFVLEEYFSSSISIVILLSCVIMSFVLVKDKANKVNFNLNSASLALIMSMIEYIKHNNIAIAFVDEGTESIDGFKFLKETINEAKKIIILDCLASGEQLVCAHRKGVDCSTLLNGDLDFIDKVYSDDTNNRLGLFKNSILLCSGEIVDKQFISINTKSKKDINVDMERLSRIRTELIKFVGGKNETIISK